MDYDYYDDHYGNDEYYDDDTDFSDDEESDYDKMDDNENLLQKHLNQQAMDRPLPHNIISKNGVVAAIHPSKFHEVNWDQYFPNYGNKYDSSEATLLGNEAEIFITDDDDDNDDDDNNDIFYTSTISPTSSGVFTIGSTTSDASTQSPTPSSSISGSILIGASIQSPITPGSITPGPITSGPIKPGTITPSSSISGGILISASSSTPSTPQPSTPQSSIPQPSIPGSSTSIPSIRQPTTRQPSTCQPSTRQSSTRQSSTRQSLTRQLTLGPSTLGQSISGLLISGSSTSGIWRWIIIISIIGYILCCFNGKLNGEVIGYNDIDNDAGTNYFYGQDIKIQNKNHYYEWDPGIIPQKTNIYYSELFKFDPGGLNQLKLYLKQSVLRKSYMVDVVKHIIFYITSFISADNLTEKYWMYVYVACALYSFPRGTNSINYNNKLFYLNMDVGQSINYVFQRISATLQKANAISLLNYYSVYGQYQHNQIKQKHNLQQLQLNNNILNQKKNTNQQQQQLQQEQTL